jgi:hypothetical protein
MVNLASNLVDTVGSRSSRVAVRVGHTATT